MNNRRIKILFTIPNFDTAGSGKVVYDLVNRLDKTIFNPEICCFHDRGDFFKEVEKLGVPIHIFPFTSSYKPYLGFIKNVWRISRFFKRNKFDIIHSWHWSSDFSEVLAARLAGVPYVFTKKAMSWGNKAWKIKSYLSNRILVLNSEMIPSFFTRHKHKTELIHLGVDLGHYRVQPETKKTPNGMTFSEDDFVVVTVANLVPIKGIEYLIEAVNLINDDNIKLLIVGNNKNEYGQRLISENTNENIKFIDKQLDVRPYHAVSDLFVIPTLTIWEGLPVAPIEAMASQRIVIGSDITGVNEVLTSHKEQLFLPKNAVDIANMIEKMKNLSISERSAIARKMRETVETSFTIENCVRKHENMYQDLIGRA